MLIHHVDTTYIREPAANVAGPRQPSVCLSPTPSTLPPALPAPSCHSHCHWSLASGCVTSWFVVCSLRSVAAVVVEVHSDRVRMRHVWCDERAAEEKKKKQMLLLFGTTDSYSTLGSTSYSSDGHSICREEHRRPYHIVRTECSIYGFKRFHIHP